MPVQPLTEVEEAELRVTLEGMSSAPWYIGRGSMYYSPDNPSRVPNTQDDCNGIVALRNAAPRLLATITMLREAAGNDVRLSMATATTLLREMDELLRISGACVGREELEIAIAAARKESK